MLEYLARQALSALALHQSPDWYLDLVVSSWFPGWEEEWRDLCDCKNVDPSIEVLAAVQSPKTTAI